MNHHDPPQTHLVHSGGATPAAATSTQWRDAELAMRVARHSFEQWLVARHEDLPSPAIMHAYHTHTALHEAARAITTLIETFRAEAGASITEPARGSNIPTQRW